MNAVMLVLLKILPIILMLGLGVWMRISSFVSMSTVNGMKKVTMNITVPALLFSVFVSTDLQPQVLLLSFIIFLTCTLQFGLGFLFQKIQKSDNPFYPSLFTTYLTGPIGFPLFIAYFGSENLYRLAILDIGNAIFLFTVLAVFLTSVSCDMKSMVKQNLRQQLMRLLRSPLPVSMFLGLAISITGLSSFFSLNPVGSAVLDTISLTANAAIPLLLIVVGYELPFDFSNFKNIFAAIAIRMTMMLILAYLINTYIIVRWLRLDEIYTAALYTLMILPPPFFIPLSIVGECDHKKFVLDFVSVHLFVSLIAFVVVMLLL
jgi:hypothetical protein